VAETKIRVNSNSIKSYATKAQGRFDGVRRELVALVDEVATVHYYGVNAKDFKTGSAQLAAEFSSSLLKDLVSIAEAIRGSTSNLTGALGGKAIHIQVNGSPVPIPPIDAGDPDVSDVDTTQLEELGPKVKSRFANLNEALRGHLADLKATDWTGQAKTSTVQGVQTFTNSAVAKSNEAEKSIIDYITQQISSANAQDKSLLS